MESEREREHFFLSLSFASRKLLEFRIFFLVLENLVDHSGLASVLTNVFELHSTTRR